MEEKICSECKRGILWRSSRKGWRERLLCRAKRLFPWQCGYCGARVLLNERGEKKQRRAARKVLSQTEPDAPLP